MNQHVRMQGLDTPALSKSVPLPPKRHPRTPNESWRDWAFNACAIPFFSLVGPVPGPGIHRAPPSSRELLHVLRKLLRARKQEAHVRPGAVNLPIRRRWGSSRLINICVC